MLSAKVMKPVNLFVTRFDYNTSYADISANVSDTLEYDHISKDSVKIQCVQLKTK